jgi:hypothetical protein
MNMARWVMMENSSQSGGVPTEFNCGVVVQHDNKPFRLNVKVRLQTELGVQLFGRPWGPLMPVLIRPDTKFGKASIGPDFDAMTLEDWKRLCPASWSANDEVSSVKKYVAIC